MGSRSGGGGGASAGSRKVGWWGGGGVVVDAVMIKILCLVHLCSTLIQQITDCVEKQATDQ